VSKFVLANVRLFTGGADLTTVNNKLELGAEVEEKESTAFVPSGSVWKEVLGGIRSTSASAAGQWEAGDTGKVDDVSFADLGSITPWTACPATAAVGSLAWLTGFLRTNYVLGGAVGDVAPWSANGSGNWPLVRGLIGHDPGTAETANGNGTAQQITGGVPSGQSLYAALHVLSVAGTSTPTVTVKIQSDNAVGFPSSTDVLTFTAATARGGQLLRAAGPITDDWFRVSWTITGTTPSFLFVVSLGVA
jgi:hypothetical protein